MIRSIAIAAVLLSAVPAFAQAPAAQAPFGAAVLMHAPHLQYKEASDEVLRPQRPLPLLHTQLFNSWVSGYLGGALTDHKGCRPEMVTAGNYLHNVEVSRWPHR